MSRDDETALQSASSAGRTLTDSVIGRLSPRQERQPSPDVEPKELLAVLENLKDALAHENVRVTSIRHSPSTVATTHATLLKSKLALDVPNVSMKELDPKCFMRWGGTDPVDQLVKDLVNLVNSAREEGRDANRAVLVIGHMPQLGWLASRLMSNRPVWMPFLDGYVTPLALKNSEVASIALMGDRNGRAAGHLEWTVAPDEAAAIEELRDKIKSKMDIAKLLGGFMTLVLGGVVLAPGRLDELSRGGDRWAVYMAAVAFLISIGLYLRTMYAYDALLMPKRYWGEGAPGRPPPRWLVRRPPSGAAWILYQNMLHVWTFLFTPATVAVAVGLLALAYAALEPGWLDGSIAALVLLVFTVYGLWRRPVLGSQD